MQDKNSPLAISFIASALDFRALLAQTTRITVLKNLTSKNLKEFVVVRRKMKKPTKCRNGVLSQSGASIFATRPIRTNVSSVSLTSPQMI